MTQKNQVLIVNVVVTHLMWETMALNVITRLVGADGEFSAIVKNRKYKRFHERHHFILMAMEVHNAFRNDMDHFMRECACLFHNR
jgi:hypothetical protein